MTSDVFYRGRTALVTGASGGIGADMARQLGSLGARVILVARSREKLEAVASEVRASGGKAVVMPSDLQAPGAGTQLAEAVANETVDVLINNAGFGDQGPFLDTPVEGVSGPVELNATVLTELTRRFLPGMVERRRGGVMNVASIAAYMPLPRFAVYAATKAYVRSFSDALHAEMRGTGVHITCLSPGTVRTGFADRAGMDDRFFSGAMDSPTVARAGLYGLAANKRTVVPGILNKVQALAPRFTPPGLALRITEGVMRRAG